MAVESLASYIKIGDDEKGTEIIEIPCERDGRLLISSISAQYPGATGIKFRSENGKWRGCRVEGNFIDPPENGWVNKNYYICKPRPTPQPDANSMMGVPNQQLLQDDTYYDPTLPRNHVPDLMIAGLSSLKTEDEIRKYFEQFGELYEFNLLKKDDGIKHRGIGFIQYKTVNSTKVVMNMPHYIANRLIDVRYTKRALDMLKAGIGTECIRLDNIPTKLFIGRLSSEASTQDLYELFHKYGPLKDIYIPPGAKGYGFVTFSSVAAAYKAMCDTHQLKGEWLLLNTANNKSSGEKEQLSGSDNPDNNNPDEATQKLLGVDTQGNPIKDFNMTAWLLDQMGKIQPVGSGKDRSYNEPEANYKIQFNSSIGGMNLGGESRSKFGANTGGYKIPPPASSKQANNPMGRPNANPAGGFNPDSYSSMNLGGNSSGGYGGPSGGGPPPGFGGGYGGGATSGYGSGSGYGNNSGTYGGNLGGVGMKSDSAPAAYSSYGGGYGSSYGMGGSSGTPAYGSSTGSSDLPGVTAGTGGNCSIPGYTDFGISTSSLGNIAREYGKAK